MKKSEAGKGDDRRPKSPDVPQEEIDANWDKLLGNYNNKDEEE